jgi:hypothetical protein
VSPKPRSVPAWPATLCGRPACQAGRQVSTRSGQSSPVAERQQNTAKPTSPGFLCRPVVSGHQRGKVHSRPCPWSARTAVPIGASSPSSRKPPRWRGFSTPSASPRAAADQPGLRLARLGRPAHRGRTRLGRPGATLTRVCLRPGSTVVASLPLPTLPGDAPFLHPRPGKPPPPHARSVRSETGSPPPRWLPHPRPSPSAPAQGLPRACQRWYRPPDARPPCGWISYPLSLPISYPLLSAL